MRQVWTCLAAWFLLTAPLGAQVVVEVTLDQTQFLPGETVVATVRVGNQSGQKLELGGANDWLTVVVETKDGLPVTKLGPIPVEKGLTVESAEVAKFRVDLDSCFDLTTPGSYQLAATVKIPQWQQQVASRVASFQIVRGTTLWEQEFGVPVSPLDTATNALPEMRRFVLLQANTIKKLQLYVRLTDATGDKIYRTYPIGLLLSFGQPERQIDRFSNLHVLHQNGARSFNYVIITPDGRMGVRETYEITTTRPHLRSGEDGRISVQGGARRMAQNDLPQPDTNAVPATNVLPQASAPATNAPAARKATAKDRKTKSSK